MSFSSPTVELYIRKIIFLKVLGFRAISIVNNKSVTKPTDLLYVLASISLGVFICYLSIEFKEELKMSKSAIANYGNFISNVAAIIVSIFSMCLAFIFRHRLWEIILNLGSDEGKVCTYLIKILTFE